MRLRIFNVLRQVTDLAWQRVARPLPMGGVELDRGCFLGEPVAIQRRLLRRAAETLTGGTQGLELGRIEVVREAIRTARSGTRWDYGVPVWVEKRTVAIAPGLDWPPSQAAREAFREHPRDLCLPGSTIVPLGRVWARVLELCPGEQPWRDERDRLAGFLDADTVGHGLRVRGLRGLRGEQVARPDTLWAAGRTSPRRVAALLTRAAVPRSWDAWLPVVEGTNGVVWVPCVGGDVRYGVGETTRRALRLAWVPCPEPTGADDTPWNGALP